jgi:tRNA U34 2-thiouridine synthase MnmA/TrmU
MISPEKTTTMVRALGLCSGGLDSILSALVLRNQGLDVAWISFETPFFTAEKARKAAQQTSIELHVEDITPEYLEMLKKPNAGFGKNMNPCMDCHALMFQKAGQYMEVHGFDFLFSGEVLGQRPMSQNSSSLRYVAKYSGYADFILRPLSAKNLPPTLMEQNGLVDREQLLDLSGRSRKPQIKLAADFGIRDYPAPAGGCLLTDPGFAKRLKDLLNHENNVGVQALYLLKYGRHLRLNPTTKVIVGRTKQDNENICAHINEQLDLLLKVEGYPGPVAVLQGAASKELTFLAASICAGYSKAPQDEPVGVRLVRGSSTEHLTVLPILPYESKRFLI